MTLRLNTGVGHYRVVRLRVIIALVNLLARLAPRSATVNISRTTGVLVLLLVVPYVASGGTGWPTAGFSWVFIIIAFAELLLAGVILGARLRLGNGNWYLERPTRLFPGPADAMTTAIRLVLLNIIVFAFASMLLSTGTADFVRPAVNGSTTAVTLNQISALYFSITTMLTVGFGDITPATPLAQTLTVAHIAVGFVVLALLLAAYSEPELRWIGRSRFSPMSGILLLSQRLAWAAGMVALTLGGATLTYCLLPSGSFADSHSPLGTGHSLSWFEAGYFAATTLSTTGFGDIAPATGEARLFVSFEMLLGLAVISAISARALSAVRSARPHLDPNPSPPPPLATVEIISSSSASSERGTGQEREHEHDQTAGGIRRAADRLGSRGGDTQPSDDTSAPVATVTRQGSDIATVARDPDIDDPVERSNWVTMILTAITLLLSLIGGLYSIFPSGTASWVVVAVLGIVVIAICTIGASYLVLVRRIQSLTMSINRQRGQGEE